jgi:tetratricopeptide (TPR) repeat protein
MELLEIFNFIIEHFPRVIAVNLFIAATVVWIVIKIRVIRHPRYMLRFVTFVILVVLIFNVIAQGLINTVITNALLVFLAILYSITAYLASKKPILYSKKKLDHLRNLIRKGYSLNDECLFDKKPFYLTDYSENYQFQMLKAEHLRALERFADAYEVYQSIDERKLFEDERTDLFIKKAFLLYTLGDINKAKHYLDFNKNEFEPYYLMLKAMIAENAMNLEEASKLWQIALNVTFETKDLLLRAMIYNNYGRIRLMEGNLTDAISFYRQSYEIAKNQKNREIINASFQNLIHTSRLKGDKQNAGQYFREYETLIPDKTLNDMKEKFNLRVEIARQNKNSEEISKVIFDGYHEIRPLLSKQRQKIFDVCVLRMMFSNKMDFEIVMERIYDNIDDYFTLKTPEKYFCLKEINISLRGIQFPHCHKYALLHNKINEYMTKNALIDIDVYISTLKDYEVHQRCSMEREKVIVQKEWIRPYRFENIYSSMSDIKDIYQKNGMFIAAIFMDLDIADECFAPENYFDNTIKREPKEKMKEHVELAAASLTHLKKYSRVVEGDIRLAMYYLVLNEREKAQKHFKAYEEAQFPINHFAPWIQRYYEMLCQEFKNNPVKAN